MVPSETTETQYLNEQQQQQQKFELQPHDQISTLIGEIMTNKSMNSDNEKSSSSTPEVSGREKLKRHRMEVAGHVWIPDLWGQEELLKEWIDCSAFDSSLFPNGLKSARAALVEEGRRRVIDCSSSFDSSSFPNNGIKSARASLVLEQGRRVNINSGTTGLRIDCSSFDSSSSLFPNGVKSARAALIEEGRRRTHNSGGLRI